MGTGRTRSAGTSLLPLSLLSLFVVVVVVAGVVLHSSSAVLDVQTVHVYKQEKVKRMYKLGNDVVCQL